LPHALSRTLSLPLLMWLTMLAFRGSARIGRCPGKRERGRERERERESARARASERARERKRDGEKEREHISKGVMDRRGTMLALRGSARIEQCPRERARERERGSARESECVREREREVSKAHRLLYHSTLGLRAIKKKKRADHARVAGVGEDRAVSERARARLRPPLEPRHHLQRERVLY